MNEKEVTSEKFLFSSSLTFQVFSDGNMIIFDKDEEGDEENVFIGKEAIPTLKKAISQALFQGKRK